MGATGTPKSQPTSRRVSPSAWARRPCAAGLIPEGCGGRSAHTPLPGGVQPGVASPDRPGLLEGHRQACAGLKTPRSGLEVTRCYFRRCPRSSDSSPTHMRGGGPQPRSVRMLRGLPGPGSPTSGPCGPNEPPAQPVGSQGLCHPTLHPSCRHPLRALVSSPPSSSGAAWLAAAYQVAPRGFLAAVQPRPPPRPLRGL